MGRELTWRETQPPQAEEQRVTSLELFFDLVFVFTLTQLTGLLAGDLSVVSGVRVALIFVVLFWMYGGYAWLTNQVPPVLPVRRLLLILGMAAFLVCALAIPRAFDGGGLAFGLGYLLVVLVHGGLYTSVYGRTMAVWVGPFNVLAALSVIAAGGCSAGRRPTRCGGWRSSSSWSCPTPTARRHGPTSGPRTSWSGTGCC